jgi:hypothetical protein
MAKTTEEKSNKWRKGFPVNLCLPVSAVVKIFVCNCRYRGGTPTLLDPETQARLIGKPRQCVSAALPPDPAPGAQLPTSRSQEPRSLRYER